MGTRLLTFPTESGEEVVVEVRAPADGAAPEGLVTRGWRVGEATSVDAVAARAGQTFDRAIGAVRPVVAALVEQLRAGVLAPDEVVVEFGIEMSADVGAFVAGASAGANFAVTMTWRRPHPGG